ncbi:hypothetical protein GCM10007049_07400 [Echinicola pacifica]|uniref:eCIS core domain-containing protein n=2 Tax=Echinicola pacifica TaxID=346377 RepID=A0A918UL07_9BACT|nr:hypothetical protein GCM10007049_07400 [Echinicola pacifica]
MGKAGDPYEVEADKMADQLVQQGTTETKSSIQNRPLASSISPITQLKPTEDPIQEKEEELQSKEEEVQRIPEFGSHADEPIQRKEGGEAPSGIASQLRNGSGGSTLPGPVNQEMSQGFGADFSGVKVHTDSEAVQMSQDLGAQAFTHGNDIYFNEGKYQPESSGGKHLLAHELTHTIQQGKSKAVQQTAIQRTEETEAPAMEPETGVLDETAKTVTFSKIGVPGFKLLNHRGNLFSGKKPLKRKNDYLRGNTNQRNGVWKPQVSKDTIKTKLNELYFNHNHVAATPATTHVFKANITGRNVMPTYIGNIDDIATELTTPTWGKDKEYRRFDVDHVVELQLANWSTESWPNTTDNMELLDSSKNSSSGSTIKNKITEKLNGFRERHNGQYPGGDADFKTNYTLVFTEAEAIPGGDSEVTENEYWTKEQIEEGEQLNAIEVGSLADIGGEGEVRIFPNAGGGLGQRFYWTGDSAVTDSNEKRYFNNPFRITAKNFVTTGEGVEQTNLLGTISVNIPPGDKTWEPWTNDKEIEVIRFKGSKYAGYITKQSIQSNLYGLRVNRTSPVEILELELMPDGIQAYGQIMPSIPIFEGSPIELFLSNGDVRISKTFSSGEINVPPPFAISDSSLTIFASSSDGLGLTGEVNFGIDRVGTGSITATAATETGFSLVGNFSFDPNLFDSAEIEISYIDNIWTIGGTIQIPEGKVRGVKSATINASYSENIFSASGEAELDIPGIERGNMSVEFGEGGFSIGGDFDLSSDIPGIQSGSVSASIAQEAGQEGYNVSVTGTAVPDIPGINSSLSVSYINGALTIEGSASYSRGMLSGTIEVGATNRPLDENGDPNGDPDDTMRVYGGGTLTLQLTPWLAATAGVTFTPEGEIEVLARLSAERYEVFARKEMNRNLFQVPTIEIPLFAIPLGPRSLGLVAQIGGGLDFTSGFGPGELRNMSAEINYNPEREDETTLSGHGEFGIPADAGLTLRGDMSLGLSVGIASLTGGIELAGTLGLAGEALASVDVNWSPQTGLTLDAEGRITVNPAFTFEVNAFARASLGIGFLSISETWRHNLASYEWGPGIQFGIAFPIHYQEGEAFDMSFDDIEVIYPDLDVINMAKGLALDIKNDLFD